MNYSAVLIIPANHRDAANNLGEELSWGPNNYSIPLSTDGTEPATHYGCRSHATEVLANLLDGAAQGQWPDGVTPVPEVVEALHVDILPDDERHGHFDVVIAAQGLMRVVTDGDL